MALAGLEGRIPDEDFHRYADLEQAVMLNRSTLQKLTGGRIVPIPLEASDLSFHR